MSRSGLHTGAKRAKEPLNEAREEAAKTIM